MELINVLQLFVECWYWMLDFDIILIFQKAFDINCFREKGYSFTLILAYVYDTHDKLFVG